MEAYISWLSIFCLLVMGCWVTVALSRQESKRSSAQAITAGDLFDDIERSPLERKEGRRKDKEVLLSKLKFMVAQKSQGLANFGRHLEITEEELRGVFLVRILSEEGDSGSPCDLILIILYLDGRMLVSYPGPGLGCMAEEYYQLPDQLEGLLSTIQTTLDAFQSEVEKRHQLA